MNPQYVSRTGWSTPTYFRTSLSHNIDSLSTLLVTRHPLAARRYDGNPFWSIEAAIALTNSPAWGLCTPSIRGSTHGEVLLVIAPKTGPHRIAVEAAINQLELIIAKDMNVQPSDEQIRHALLVSIRARLGTATDRQWTILGV